MSKPALSRALAAEFIAMTLFVWVGCGTAVASQALDLYRGTEGTAASFLLSTATAFGLGIAVLAYTIAPVSGGHINPAVTTSLFLLGEIDATSAIAYIFTQFIAAVLGAGIVWGSMSDSFLKDEQGGAPPFGLGANSVQADLHLGSAFLIEFMGTFLLVWTVCMTAVSKNSIAANIAPIAIGWSVLLAHLVLIPYTGCGINPARSFGPHLVMILAGEKVGYEGWWIYYTAPFVGGAAAAMAYKFIFTEPAEEGAEVPKEIASKNSSEEEVAPIPGEVEENA